MRHHLSFVEDKVAYLKKAGLVSNQHTGYGENGGACPDWLLTEQKQRRNQEEKRAMQVWARSSGKQPDIEWVDLVEAA